MEANEFYTEAIAQSSKVLKQVRLDQFDLPTPDSEWSVRDLCDHMLHELLWVPDVLDGKTMEEAGELHGGELFEAETDLMITWERAVAAAEEALETYDPEMVVHLSSGDTKVTDYLLAAAMDQLIHAWDLGQAIGAEVTYKLEVARKLYDYFLEKDLASTGMFAPAVAVPEDADLQTKVLALTGRKRSWQA